MELPRDAESYLSQLRMSLSALSDEERDEIVREVRSHLLDRHAAGKSPLLEGFDAPEDYASQFLGERLLRGALAQGTPWALGRALWVAARDSLLGMFVLLPLAVLGLMGVTLVILSALKPFFPDQIGLIHSPGHWVLGFVSERLPTSVEMLGWWSIPLFALGGCALLACSTLALRALARWRLQRLPKRV